MREQADVIQKEVGLLLQDVKRLGERVGNLRRISTAPARTSAKSKSP